MVTQDQGHPVITIVTTAVAASDAYRCLQGARNLADTIYFNFYLHFNLHFKD